MGFRCESCERVVPRDANESPRPVRVVVETRERTYVNGGKVSLGTEIVREELRCRECAK